MNTGCISGIRGAVQPRRVQLTQRQTSRLPHGGCVPGVMDNADTA
jgi:hypothetical protein